MTKYGAVPTYHDGRRYASKAEARRAVELRALEMAGEIHDLEYQPGFDLWVNGVKVGTYVADFAYRTKGGLLVVEDVKSKPTMTPVYRLKRKLMLAIHGVTVTEVAA